MKTKSTLTEIAEKAGVSIATNMGLTTGRPKSIAITPPQMAKVIPVWIVRVSIRGFFAPKYLPA